MSGTGCGEWGGLKSEEWYLDFCLVQLVGGAVISWARENQKNHLCVRVQFIIIYLGVLFSFRNASHELYVPFMTS